VSIVVDNLMAVIEVWWFLRMRPFGAGYAVVVAASLGCVGAVGVIVRLTIGATVPGFAVFLLTAGAAYGAVLYRWRRVLRIDTFLAAMRGVRTPPEPVPATKG
jgi:hypothetical protein